MRRIPQGCFQETRLRARVACSKLLLGLLLGVLTLWACGEGGAASPVPPRLQGVIAELLDIWQHADLVCLGETHGSIFDGLLRQELVEHPRFPEIVDVIVVEFANPLHQNLLDRLVLDLEPLTREMLRPIWRDAGLGEVWELPPYEDFLRSVAAMNARRPKGERIPIIGAALPIDWQTVRGPADLELFRDRISHFEAVLRQEIIRPGRKGLAIFGSGHCERRPPSAFSRLVAENPERVRAVFGFDADGGAEAGRRALGLGKLPQLVKIRASAKAETPSGDMFFEGHGQVGVRLGELVDAIVYYGEAEDVVLDPAALEMVPELAQELERRAALWLVP